MKYLKASLAVAFVMVICFVGTAFNNSGTISLNRTTWSAGSVPVGGQNKTTITVTNTGSVPVTVNAINESGSNEFGDAYILPVTIPAHGAWSFTINFTPTTGGSVSGTFTIKSTATNTPTVSVSGTGTQTVANLSWDASASASDPCWTNIKYIMYRGPATNGPFSNISGQLSALNFPDSSVQSGNTYYWQVTAIGDYTNSGSCPAATSLQAESPPSNQVSRAY